MKGFVFIGLLVAISSTAQVRVDTLYYDKNWKGVETTAFASYFRVMAHSTDDNSRKQIRDYYITGELLSELSCISIDKYDDSKSVFDGEFINYFKSGKVEGKWTFVKGKLEGECVEYYENGLVSFHGYFKKGELDGIYTEFSEDGSTCAQVEYSNGKPLYDCYTISNKDGQCSKIRISDGQPIYGSPLLSEQQVEYRNGKTWCYYNKDGMMIGMTNDKVRDYGNYYKISLVLANNSMFPIEFDPSLVTASLADKRGRKWILQVYSAARYMKKVRRKQNRQIIGQALSEVRAAYGAGYSSSATNASHNGRSYSSGYASAHGSGGYAYGNYSGGTSHYGNSTSATTSHNGTAAYQARMMAMDRVGTYENELLAERTARDEGYLKRTTLNHGETISGYIHIERKRGTTMTINVQINEATYTFPWNVL